MAVTIITNFGNGNDRNYDSHYGNNNSNDRNHDTRIKTTLTMSITETEIMLTLT